MTFSEKLLLFISKNPNSYTKENYDVNLDRPLHILERSYPNLDKLVKDKNIVDFGCGVGLQSIALVKTFSCNVIGVDTNLNTLQLAKENAKRENISEQRLNFVDNISSDMINKFDIVISQNSFEHFSNPKDILFKMASLLNESGKLLITFGPPWYAPYGSHMNYFCKLPWLNVFFSEESIMKVRSRFRNDGAKKYEEVESGLNQMTVAKFESIINSSNLKIEFKKYDCVKGLNFLSKLPFLREFFINHITAIVVKLNTNP